MKFKFLLRLNIALLCSLISFVPAWADNQRVLRVVPHANLSVLDPIWTTAYISRNHGYMVYDTLFAEDTKGKVRPQMVDTYKATDNNKTWTFTLRKGLKFHDGNPVTSADVVASLKRWSSRDALGGVLANKIERYETPNKNTFVIIMKEPVGIVLDALGKVSSNVPFIMPERIANTPGSEQIKEVIGSGPFKFKADEFVSGSKVVYERFQDYVPRKEAADGLAGGKVVNVDRVEWVIIRDPQTQFNALKTGEVDMVEQPAFEQYEALKKTPGVKVAVFSPSGYQFIIRFNHTLAPFDKLEVRRAAMLAMGQKAYIATQIGVPELGSECRSMYPCGTLYADEKNVGEFTGKPQMSKAREVLKKSGYDGTPIVLMRPTDLAVISKLPLVAEQQLRAAGFNVDVQQMDWASLVARRSKKDPVDQGGWNIFLTSWTAADIATPLTMAMFNMKVDGTGWFGWQKNAEVEELKAKFASSGDATEKKQIASQIQKIAFETVSHVPLGQFAQPAAYRDNISGLLDTPGPIVFWNIKKK